MGRLATNLARYASNVDNLPSSDKLPQVYFWEAVLPSSCDEAFAGSKGSKREKEVSAGDCVLGL